MRRATCALVVAVVAPVAAVAAATEGARAPLHRKQLHDYWVQLDKADVYWQVDPALAPKKVTQNVTVTGWAVRFGPCQSGGHCGRWGAMSWFFGHPAVTWNEQTPSEFAVALGEATGTVTTSAGGGACRTEWVTLDRVGGAQVARGVRTISLVCSGGPFVDGRLVPLTAVRRFVGLYRRQGPARGRAAAASTSSP